MYYRENNVQQLQRRLLHSRAEIAAAPQLSEERLVARQLAEEELRRTRVQCGGSRAAGTGVRAAVQCVCQSICFPSD